MMLTYIVILILFTNGTLLNSSGSISNADDYCCEKFGYDAWCPNVAPCLGGPRTLGVNGIFLKLIIVSVLFGVSSTLHIVLNSRFRVYEIIF